MMRVVSRTLLAVLIAWTCTTPAHSAVTLTGVQATMTWTEPIINADGSPLTDLARTEGTYQLPGGVETICGSQPAATATGGGSISVSCTVPVADGQELDVTFQAYAYDLSGNKSQASSLIKRIDLLAPGAPTF